MLAMFIINEMNYTYGSSVNLRRTEVIYAKSIKFFLTNKLWIVLCHTVSPEQHLDLKSITVFALRAYLSQEMGSGKHLSDWCQLGDGDESDPLKALQQLFEASCSPRGWRTFSRHRWRELWDTELWTLLDISEHLLCAVVQLKDTVRHKRVI